jgi:hypothetical protein
MDIFNSYDTFSNIFELSRPFAFILFYYFYRTSHLNISSLETTTIKSITVVFLLLSIYSILEFIYPNYIEQISSILYKREKSGVKAVGSYGITYHFAYALIIPLLFHIICFIRKFNLKYFLFFIFYFFAYILTQSRSMYIALVICFILIIISPYFYKSLQTSLKIIFFLFFILFLSIHIYSHYYNDLRDTFSYAVKGLEAISEDKNKSVNARQLQMEWVLRNNKIIFLGYGISKDVIMLESFYSLYYYRYGLIGIILLLSLTTVTAIRAYKIAIWEYKNIYISSFYFCLFIFYIATPIELLGSCNQDSPKISLSFYGLIGMVFNKYAVITKNRYALRFHHNSNI